MYAIFEELCKQKGVTPYKVSKDTGISTATLTSWKQGKYAPKDEKRRKIAEYFGVTLEYLDGVEKTEDTSALVDQIDTAYLSLAKDLQNDGIDPDDIRMMVETLKKYRK